MIYSLYLVCDCTKRKDRRTDDLLSERKVHNCLYLTFFPQRSICVLKNIHTPTHRPKIRLSALNELMNVALYIKELLL